MIVLVIDIGGTHVKFRTQKQSKPIRFKSGSKMTPQRMMAKILEGTKDWKFDCVTIGYPGPVVHNKLLLEPHNLSRGWVNFDFEKAFRGKKVRILNDAALQALGSYRDGRMLYLGLGTGLGSAMVVEGVVQPMELAHLPWKKGRTYEEYLGAAALEKFGKKKWLRNVLEVTQKLQQALASDYVVLGGGNSELVDPPPERVFIGDNGNAFKGGFMIWQKKYGTL
jgi:polyphosphate glucokinase